jgi:hypothetical protein
MVERGPTKKSVMTDFSIYESRQKPICLKCLELKMFCLYGKNSFALVFKEMNHCCVVCCIHGTSLKVA